MKFSIEKAITSGGRLGLITVSCHHGNITLETPMCTLFTKGGSAPHLSMDMLQKIVGVPQMATMSIGTLAKHHESVAEFGKGLREFTAMKNKIVFTTQHDASLEVPTGKNDRISVALWGKGGKTKVDTKLFMKIQEAFQPDWFQALSDGDTDRESTKKRLGKSVDRTLDFLDEIVEMWQKSKVLNKASLIGVIEGGFDVEERKRSAKETSLKPVHGFLIEGFEKGNSGKDLFSYDDFADILSKTTSCLPDDKPRIMETVWSPLQVIKAFRLGIDLFSSAYPHTLTEQGYALVIDYTLPPRSQAGKLEVEGSNLGSDGHGFHINLNDKRYFEDFRPVLQDCPCYTCANFTRSYIHHLLNTSELLSYVLLTIHNFHQYFNFFQQLRQVIREDKLEELEASLMQQLPPPAREEDTSEESKESVIQLSNTVVNR